MVAVAETLKGGTAPAPPATDQCRFFPETQHRACLGFRAFYESHDDALQLFGYPISEEFDLNGLTVQYFERARFEWHPNEDCGNDWHVMLGRVGAESADEAKAANPAAFAPVQP